MKFYLTSDVEYTINFSYFTHRITNLVKFTMGDLIPLVISTEKFVTGELYQRAKETGVGQAHIGPKSLCERGWLPTIYLVRGNRDIVAQVTNYDGPGARIPFNIVSLLSGQKTIVNYIGHQAHNERVMIKEFLMGDKAAKTAYEFTMHFIPAAIQEWQSETRQKTLQHYCTYISANIIGHCVFNINHVPHEYVNDLMKAGRLVVTPFPSPKQINQNHQQLKKLTTHVLNDPQSTKLAGYPRSQVESKYSNLDNKLLLSEFKKMNIGAKVIVEGNLSFLIMSGILLVSQNEIVRDKLRKELYGFNWQMKMRG